MKSQKHVVHPFCKMVYKLEDNMMNCKNNRIISLSNTSYKVNIKHSSTEHNETFYQ